MKCSVDECDDTQTRRTRLGMCHRHNDIARDNRKRGLGERCRYCGSPLTSPVMRDCDDACRISYIKASRRTPFESAWRDGRWNDVIDGLRSRSREVFGCWEWLAKPCQNGYCQVRFGASRLYAHRIAAEAGQRARLPQGMTAHHRCANRRCVNPEHVVPATQAENIAEMMSRRALLAEIDRLKGLLNAAGIAYGVERPRGDTRTYVEIARDEAYRMAGVNR